MQTYLTVRDVAHYFAVKDETVRRWLRKGLLQGIPLGRAGYRIEPAALEAFLHLRQQSSSLATSPQTRPSSRTSPDVATRWQCLEELTDGFFVLNRQWELVFLNRSAAHLLNKADEPLLGKNFWTLFDSLQGTTLTHTLSTSMQTRQARECDEATLIPNRWFHIRVQPVTEGIAVSLLDITERRQATLYQARQAHIVQDSEAVIFSVTPTGSIITWNHGAELFYGYLAEEVLGHSIALISSPEVDAEQLQVVARLSWTKRADYFTTVHMHKSGRPLPVSLHLSPLQDAHNSVVSVTILSHDLSRNEDIEKRVLVHKEQRSLMVENALPYGIWIADAQGRLEYASQSFLNLLHMTLSDCQHQGWYHLVPQEEIPSIQATWHRCWEKGDVWTIIYHVRGYDRQYHTILSHGRPLYDNDGNVVRWLGVHLNVGTVHSFHHAVVNEGDV